MREIYILFYRGNTIPCTSNQDIAEIISEVIGTGTIETIDT